MKISFEQSLLELNALLGEDAAARVLRTEVRPDESIVLTVALGDGFGCFRFDGVRTEPLELENETAVRFAATVVELRRQGSARLLSWRPGRRLVARVIEDGRVGVVKAWRKGRASRAVALHDRARSALTDVLVVPRPEWIDVVQDAVRFESFVGDAPLFSDAALCGRIGASIATLQQRMESDDLPQHSRADEIANLRRMAQQHIRIGVESANVVLDLTSDLDHLVYEAPEPTVAAHGDLHDGQFAISGDSIAVFDFDLARRAEPELDVANLCVHLEWCGIQRARGLDELTSSRFERTVVRGFGKSLDERALAFYRASTALRLALVWGVRPRWRSQTDALLKSARRAIVEVSCA